jgi:hypothetical protein
LADSSLPPFPGTLLCAELPNELAARKVAQKLAEMLCEKSKASGATIVVTDQHGNKVCEVPLRYMQ